MNYYYYVNINVTNKLLKFSMSKQNNQINIKINEFIVSDSINYISDILKNKYINIDNKTGSANLSVSESILSKFKKLTSFERIISDSKKICINSMIDCFIIQILCFEEEIKKLEDTIKNKDLNNNKISRYLNDNNRTTQHDSHYNKYYEFINFKENLIRNLLNIIIINIKNNTQIINNDMIIKSLEYIENTFEKLSFNLNINSSSNNVLNTLKNIDENIIKDELCSIFNFKNQNNIELSNNNVDNISNEKSKKLNSKRRITAVIDDSWFGKAYEDNTINSNSNNKNKNKQEYSLVLNNKESIKIDKEVENYTKISKDFDHYIDRSLKKFEDNLFTNTTITQTNIESSNNIQNKNIVYSKFKIKSTRKNSNVNNKTRLTASPESKKNSLNWEYKPRNSIKEFSSILRDNNIDINNNKISKVKYQRKYIFDKSNNYKEEDFDLSNLAKLKITKNMSQSNYNNSKEFTLRYNKFKESSDNKTINSKINEIRQSISNTLNEVKYKIKTSNTSISKYNNINKLNEESFVDKDSNNNLEIKNANIDSIKDNKQNTSIYSLSKSDYIRSKSNNSLDSKHKYSQMLDYNKVAFKKNISNNNNKDCNIYKKIRLKLFSKKSN